MTMIIKEKYKTLKKNICKHQKFDKKMTLKFNSFKITQHYVLLTIYTDKLSSTFFIIFSFYNWN